MKRKGTTNLYLKSQISQIQKEHKRSIPIETISLNEQKNIKPE